VSPILIDQDGEPVELGTGRGDLRYSSVPLSSWDTGSSAFFGDQPVSYANIYASQPQVAIAVNRLLTWAVRVPLKLYRRTDNDGARERVRPSEHPLAAAFEHPWNHGSQADFVQTLLGPLCVHGNSLLDVDLVGKRLKFESVDWRAVKPIRVTNDFDPFDEIAGWEITNAKGKRVVSADKVVHLRWWSPLGTLGISPLRQLRTTLISESAAIDWAIQNLKQGVRPSGVVEMTDAVLGMRPDDRRKLYEKAVADLREKHGGEANAGKLPIIPPGLKWTTADHTTAVEAQLVNQRLVNRNEVASIYQVPPPTIGHLERATFNNISELRQMAYTDGLAPPLVLIEQKINTCVINEMLQIDDMFCEFDLGLILRGDRLKEIQALRQGVGSALYTPNEGRSALNMPASNAPGADDLYLPTNNLSPLGEPQVD